MIPIAGASEGFVPDDAEILIEGIETGSSVRANKLTVLERSLSRRTASSPTRRPAARRCAAVRPRRAAAQGGVGVPPLGLHMTVARDLARELEQHAIDADRGAYYLGATTPDIRIITRWDRASRALLRPRRPRRAERRPPFFEHSRTCATSRQLGARRRSSPATSRTSSWTSSYISEIYRPVFGARGARRRGEGEHHGPRAAVRAGPPRPRRRGEGRRDPDALASLRRGERRFRGAGDTSLEWRRCRASTCLATRRRGTASTGFAGRYLAAAGIEGDEDVERVHGDVPALLRRPSSASARSGSASTLERRRAARDEGVPVVRIVQAPRKAAARCCAASRCGETELPAHPRKNAEIFGADLGRGAAGAPHHRRRARATATRRSRATAARSRRRSHVVRSDARRDRGHRTRPLSLTSSTRCARRAAHRRYHERQLNHSSRSFSDDGVGMQVRPIERVGMYVPTSLARCTRRRC